MERFDQSVNVSQWPPCFPEEIEQLILHYASTDTCYLVSGDKGSFQIMHLNLETGHRKDPICVRWLDRPLLHLHVHYFLYQGESWAWELIPPPLYPPEQARLKRNERTRTFSYVSSYAGRSPRLLPAIDEKNHILYCAALEDDSILAFSMTAKVNAVLLRIPLRNHMDVPRYLFLHYFASSCFLICFIEMAHNYVRQAVYSLQTKSWTTDKKVLIPYFDRRSRFVQVNERLYHLANDTSQWSEIQEVYPTRYPLQHISPRLPFHQYWIIPARYPQLWT